MSEEQKTHIATVSILVRERGTHAKEVNEILTRHGDRIIARLGVHLERAGITRYGGLITVITEGTAAEIKAMTDELDALYGIVAKTSVLD
ncbi:MAG: CopG family transcriptional regulator [Candidatus Moraniibacteriota bacterium]